MTTLFTLTGERGLVHVDSLVIACCKTAEATAEKLAPRYAELYTALHSLIHHPAPSLSASAIASTSKKTAGLGVGTSKHASIKLPLRTTAKFEMPKGVLPEPTRVSPHGGFVSPNITCCQTHTTHTLVCV